MEQQNRRMLEEDAAPVDYNTVRSVAEGISVERQQRIHRDPAMAGLAVRHRAEPAQSPADPPRRRRAQAAVPETRHDAPNPYGIPDNPFAAPAAAEPAAVPQPHTAEPVHQPRFARPATPEIPDWLRTAQHNNMPLERSGPTVRHAPDETRDPLGRPVRNASYSSVYQDAGYPEELVDVQRRMEAEAAAQPIRRRHGAQYGMPQQPFLPPRPDPQPVQQQPGPSSWPPPREDLARRVRPQEAYRVEDDETDESPRFELPDWARRVPWLSVAAFIAVMIAIFQWISLSSSQRLTQAIYDERAANEESILQKHPLRHQEIIADKANRYNLHPAFVAAIMLNESSFRPDATAESTGARGLMQLMDETAEWIHGKLDDGSVYHFDLMYDPERNAEYGCWYLNYLSSQFYGDPVLVAAAFHAGQGEVRNWLNNSLYSADGRTIDLEDMIDGNTKQYVQRVLNDYAAYKRLYYGG